MIIALEYKKTLQYLTLNEFLFVIYVILSLLAHKIKLKYQCLQDITILLNWCDNFILFVYTIDRLL